MRILTLTIAILGMTLATPATAQTVQIELASPQNGTTVEPGTTIEWTINFNVLTETGIEGLALLSVDLAQDNDNPGYLDIPPADAVPAHMTNFSRPAGICNPGETTPATGYTGLQRGTPGRQNLLQIGGAQNTLGQAMAPGTGVAENAVVETGVGQSGALVLASGSFQAPSAEGEYVFRLQTGVANVLTTPGDPPPPYSPVVEANVVPTLLGAEEITFTVEVCQPCDANCDAKFNGLDVQSFVDALLGTGTPCSSCAADLDGNETVDENDIAAFLDCLIPPAP